jgi:23S rRNA (adenine2503-C2)-methyltransferase
MELPIKQNMLGIDLQELTAIAEAYGQPRYRGRQLFDALYRQRTSALEEITNLPRDFREKLGEQYQIALPEIEHIFQSDDGTVRYLLRLGDGQSVEAVWMPEGDDGESGDGSQAGEEETAAPTLSGEDRTAISEREEGSRRQWRRSTICVSSQAGCAVNCQFCLTAKLGLLRNLTAGEIVGEVLSVLKDQQVAPPADRVNLVFMGQGEPFHNYVNFIAAARLLVEGVGIPELRMTVSTAGIVPRIHDFGREPVRPKLAISLNGSHDEQRSELMPLNRKWKLAELIEAARQFPLRPRERLTFEYVLLGGTNDSGQDAQRVARLLHGLRAKVNLIAWNPGPGIAFATPSQESVLGFQKILVRAGIPTFIRKPRGRDIFAACGQLKQTVDVTRLG